MNQAITVELQFFLISILWGAILLLVYDGLRILRRVIKHDRFFIAVEDLIFWVLASLFIFAMMYKENNGIIRGFSVMGMAIGMVIYHYIISDIFVTMITKLIHMLLRPFSIAYNSVKKFILFLASKGKKVLKFLLSRLKKHYQSVKITLNKRKQKHAAIKQKRMEKKALDNLEKNKKKNEKIQSKLKHEEGKNKKTKNNKAKNNKAKNKKTNNKNDKNKNDKNKNDKNKEDKNNKSGYKQPLEAKNAKQFTEYEQRTNSNRDLTTSKDIKVIKDLTVGKR